MTTAKTRVAQLEAKHALRLNPLPEPIYAVLNASGTQVDHYIRYRPGYPSERIERKDGDHE